MAEAKGGTEAGQVRVEEENLEEKRETETWKKRGRFERQKEKAVLIFTNSQCFLNILLLPAV